MINYSSVPIVALPSRTALRIKNFTNPRVILTSPSAVPNAVKQGSQGDMETLTIAMAIRPNAKCFPRFVPIVARKPRYRSNPVRTDQCIVTIATVK